MGVLLATSVKESFARHYAELSNAHPRDPEGVQLLATGWLIGHALWAAEKIETPFVQNLVGKLALSSAPVSLGLALGLESWNRKVRIWLDHAR